MLEEKERKKYEEERIYLEQNHKEREVEASRLREKEIAIREKELLLQNEGRIEAGEISNRTQEEKQKKILDKLKAKEAQRLKNLAEEISKIERDAKIALEQKAKEEIEKEILLIDTRREKKEKETALLFFSRKRKKERL